ncbi:MAG: SLC13 family permease [Desulfobacterales bacterium]
MDLSRKHTGLVLGLAVALAAGFLLPLPHPARVGFAAILFWITCIIFGVFPNHLTGLGLILSPILLGSAPAEVALKSATSPLWWMLLMGFVIGAGFIKTGLGRRIAYFFASTFVSGWYSVILTIFVVNAVLNIIAPFSTVAQIAITYEIYTQMAHEFGFAPRSRGYNGILLAMVASSILAGELVLTGWSLNPLAVGLFRPIVDLDFISWLKYITPIALLFLIMAYASIVFLYKPRPKPVLMRSVVREKYLKLGPLSLQEKKVLLISISTLIVFPTQPLHGLDGGWLSLGVSLLLFFPGIGVLNEKDFAALNWPFMWFFLGVFSIGDQLVYHEVHTWLAEIAMPDNIHRWPGTQANVYTALILVALHLPVGTMAPLMACFLPAMGQYAAANGMPLVATFGVILFAAKRWVFPFQEAMVLMTMGMSNGRITAESTVKLGVVLTILYVTVLIPLSTGYWRLIGAP